MMTAVNIEGCDEINGTAYSEEEATVIATGGVEVVTGDEEQQQTNPAAASTTSTLMPPSLLSFLAVLFPKHVSMFYGPHVDDVEIAQNLAINILLPVFFVRLIMLVVKAALDFFDDSVQPTTITLDTMAILKMIFWFGYAHPCASKIALIVRSYRFTS
jgi:hypothetical protein